MSQKKYWKSFGEQQQSEAWQKQAKDEFREELPFEDFDSHKLADAKSPRRDFLKYLGFSTAAAALAASCKQPVKTAIPYAVKPDNIIPGVADLYATTYINNGEAIPVVAKVRDGRPIKIDGNDLCSYTKGGSSARVQASVLDLYDMARLRFPVERFKDDYAQVPTFEQLDKKIADEMAALGGGSVVLLTGTINSESTKVVIDQFVKARNAKHIQYDPISYSGMLLANEATYGRRVIPSYHFDKAKVIVSLGADFLGTWVAPIEHARQYSAGRKVTDSKKEMSKHYQFESILSMTGANADERFIHKPSQTGAVAAAILAGLTGGAGSINDAKLKAGIAKVVNDLNANKGAALVVSGSNDVNVQIIVNAINNAIGASGTTISWGMANQCIQGDDAAVAQLLTDMKAGNVGALLIHGVNPVYTHPMGKEFEAALAKVKLSISFNEKKDETSVKCKYIIPDHHFLESWGDAQPKTGYTSFIQPTIHPLFKTRAWQTSLLKWSGTNVEYAEFYKNAWIQKLGSQEAFDKVLQTGVIEPTAVVIEAGTFNGARVAEAVSKAAVKDGGMEVVLYQKVGMGDGRYANNPWLQEMPDPVTKATWDNYIIVGAATAKALDINYMGSDYEYHPEKPKYTLTVGGKSVTLPVLVVPGCAKDVIGIAVGYGRSEKIGIAATGAGEKAFHFATFDGAAVQYQLTGAKIEKAGGSYKIAQNQVHNYYENRTAVVKERTLGEAIKNGKEILDEREKEFAPYGGLKNYRKQGTIYPDYAEGRGLHWGMSVDLNSCIGCGACVVACNVENNVSVVGKTEVTRGHDMHWIRIDRYYSSKPAGDPDEVDVVFNPTMCQHCDNAPCENVCPVAATNHSSEGLNQMTYNRCIGTRYCANNCPYKVRRFNWADYNGADSFPNNQDKASGLAAVVVEQMNDDLTRMVLNPDVTVRSRGVIEKCSFCVQRLQEGKLKAKKENRELADADVKVACAQACPTNAITFGNANNPNSEIAKLRSEEQTERLYYALEMLHTLPNVNYLAKIRNKEAISGLEVEHHGGAAHHEGGAGHGAGEKHGAEGDKPKAESGH
jgi:MoCo/4Fe-4S cofactor protein with predicted Tat translocation signal